MGAGTDRLTRRGSFRVAVEELPALGLPPPQRLAVPANTLVVADTHGFHARGASARPARRVEIWAYGRRNPFLPWAGLDPWRLPHLNVWHIPLAWWAGDLAERARIRPQVWRKKPQACAFDALPGSE